MELHEEACRGGHTKAASNLGGLCEQKGDLPKAIQLYEEARCGGEAKAVFSLGNLYRQRG